MSTTIDERVVAMKFDNQKFQKNIGETQKSLEDLKNGLKFDGAKKGFADINAAAGKVDLKNLSKNVDGVSSRFTALQAVAFGVFASIGAKALQLGQNLVHSIVGDLSSGMRDGFSDYNLKLTSVQTIMNATGASIEKVNSYFDELDEYADKTIYNLQDMTGAFAKFTNAGIDMDKAIPAIKGISNMVALAGQDANAASIAYYNLSQSLAGGFLTTTDYRSLNLANVATKEWKNNMIEAAVEAGNLKRVGKDLYKIPGVEKAVTGAALFNEQLSTGWASASVLLGVLGDYGDATTEIGKKALAAAQNVKSLPMMIDTIKASIGTGWTETFEKVLGNVIQSTELFTGLTNEIQAYTDASAEARNEQLKIWADLGGREALFNTQTGALFNIFKAIRAIITPLKEAWAEVFPPSLGKTLAAISFALRDFTKGLILSEGAQKNLKFVAKALFTVLKFGLDIVGGIFKVFFTVVGIVWDLTSAFLGLLGPVITFVKNLFPMRDGAEEASSGIGGLFTMLSDFLRFITGPLIGGLKNLQNGMDSALNGGAIGRNISRIIDWFKQLGATVQSVYSILFKGRFKENPWFAEDSPFSRALFKIREIFKDLFSGAQGFAKKVLPAIKGVFEAIRDGFANGFKNIDWNIVLSALNTGIFGVIVFQFIKLIRSLDGVFKGAGIFSTLGDALGELTGVLKSMQLKLKAEALRNIAVSILLLAGALLVMSNVDPDRVISSSAGLAAAVGVMVGAMIALDKIAGGGGDTKFGRAISSGRMLLIGTVLIQMATAMTILSLAIHRLGSMDLEDLAKGIGAISVMFGLMIAAVTMIGKVHKQVAGAAASMLLLAIALNLLIAPVLALGALPYHVLIQGMTALGILLAGLIGAVLIIKKVQKDIAVAALALLAMAGALNALVVPLTVLGLLPYPVLEQGMLSLAVMLTGLVVAALAISKVEKQMALAAVGMMAMAAALNMLVAPISILGLLPLGTLSQGILAVAATLAVLVIAAHAMGGNEAIKGAAGIIALSAAIFIMSTALAIVAAIPSEAVFVAIGALALLLTTVAVFGAIFGAASQVFLTGAVVLLAFSGALLVLAAAIVVAAFGIATLGPAIISLTAGLLVFAKASGAIAGASGPMVLIGLAMIALGAGAAVAAIGVGLLGIAMVILAAGFATLGATALIGATAVIAAVNALLPLLNQAGPIALLGGILAVLGAGVVILGAGMVLAGAGAVIFGVGLALIGVSAVVASTGLMLMGVALQMLIPVISQLGQVVPGLTVLLASLGAFALVGAAAGASAIVLGLGLIVLAGGLALIQAVGPGAAVSLVVMVSLIGKLADQAGPLAIFGAAMLALGAGLLVFGAGALVAGAGIMVLALGLGLIAVVGMSGAKALGKVVEAIAGLVWNIPALTAMGAAFGVLALGLGALGLAMIAFGTGAMLSVAAMSILVGIGPLVNATVENLIKTFMRLAGQAPTFAVAAQTLGILGVAISTVAVMGMIAAAQIMIIINALDRLGSTSKKAGDQFKSAMNVMKTSIDSTTAKYKSFGDASKKMADDLIATFKKISEGINKSKGDISKAIDSLINKISSDVKSGLSSVKTDVYASAKGIGRQMVNGMVQGLNENKSRVQAAARSIARAAIQASEAELGVASPSKEYARIGRHSDEGLAQGMDKHVSVVETASRGVAKAALDAMRKSLSDVSSAVMIDPDMQPTIKPVLDLSAIRKGAPEVNSLLNKQVLSLTPTTEFAVSTANAVTETREAASSEAEVVRAGDTIFNQYNNSPKALSAAEIYRQTNNQINSAKDAKGVKSK